MKIFRRNFVVGVVALFAILGATFAMYADNDNDEFKGALRAVDLQAMTVQVGNQTFTLHPNAFVEVDQPGPDFIDSLENLPNYVGRFVEVKLDVNEQILILEVKSKHDEDDDDHDGDHDRDDDDDDD